jgi:hypothetical protein
MSIGDRRGEGGAVFGRRQVRRRLSLAVAMVLAAVALTAPAGGVLAGARVVFFGSPGHDGETILSPVQVGKYTEFRLFLRNDSGQTVNHASVVFGDNAGPGSLSAGATIVQVAGPDAGACTGVPGRSMTCDYGQLRAGEPGHLITVVVDPGTASPLVVVPEAQINETQGTTNPDTFLAPGTTTPFVAGEKVGLVVAAGNQLFAETTFGANALKVGVSIGRVSTGLDTLAILEGEGNFCQTGYSCAGPVAQLAINFGDALSPAAQLTLTTTDKSMKFAGLLHKLDDGTIADIPNTKANVCTTSTQTDCVVLSKPGILTVRIDENGYIKIY